MEVLVTFLLVIGLAALVVLAGFFFLHFMMSIIITTEGIRNLKEEHDQYVKSLEEEDGD